MTAGVHDLWSEVDRIVDGNHLSRPPVRRDGRGRWQRADTGEWDWFWDLDQSTQRYIRSHWMSDQGVEPDVVASWHGSDVDTVMGAWADALKIARRKVTMTLDPLDDAWEGPEEPSPYDDASDLELVGPVEIADRAGVSRNAIAQWRRRYADFPVPLAVLGGSRTGPKGGSGGMPVWTWPAVYSWLVATGRTIG